MAALERYTASGEARPRDLGGSATTRQVTEALLAFLEGRNT